MLRRSTYFACCQGVSCRCGSADWEKSDAWRGEGTRCRAGNRSAVVDRGIWQFRHVCQCSCQTRSSLAIQALDSSAAGAIFPALAEAVADGARIGKA